MATHKIPQDVEAEDKLLGPLSLKQFIFVILGGGFCFLIYFFATKVHFLTSVIWLPPAAFFLILGLYQRKDQPAEVFLASALRFYFKPRTRKWDQDGYQERVVITAPPKIERQYTKNFTGAEATSRLAGLSRMMDTRGWASRLQSQSEWQNPALATAAASSRIAQPVDTESLNGINLQAYAQPVDMMDESTNLTAFALQQRIDSTQDASIRQAKEVLQQARQEALGQKPAEPTTAVNQQTPEVRHDPFPKAIHQKVVSPLPQTPDAQPQAIPPEQTNLESPRINSAPTGTATPNAPQPIEKVDDDGSVSVQLR